MVSLKLLLYKVWISDSYLTKWENAGYKIYSEYNLNYEKIHINLKKSISIVTKHFRMLEW